MSEVEWIYAHFFKTPWLRLAFLKKKFWILRPDQPFFVLEYKRNKLWYSKCILKGFRTSEAIKLEEK